MALETKMTILDSTNFTIGTPWSDDVPITGGVGYMSAILEVLTSAAIKNIKFGWRPIVKDNDATPEQIESRWLPVYIDLKGTSDGDQNFVQPPEFGRLYDLTAAELLAGYNYYLYFVHPETPAAVPLLRDEQSNHFGIQIAITSATDIGTPAFTFRINVLATVES